MPNKVVVAALISGHRSSCSSCSSPCIQHWLCSLSRPPRCIPHVDSYHPRGPPGKIRGCCCTRRSPPPRNGLPPRIRPPQRRCSGTLVGRLGKSPPLHGTPLVLVRDTPLVLVHDAPLVLVHDMLQVLVHGMSLVLVHGRSLVP